MRVGPVRLLLLLILMLTGGLAWMWFDQNAQLRNLNWVAPKALPPDIKVPAGLPETGSMADDAPRFAVILERPLFAPDRRPPPPPIPLTPPTPPPPPPPPDPLASIQIKGIFSGANAGIIARVDGKMRRVKVNDTIGAWTLKSIDGRDITFERGDEKRQLRLAYARLDVPLPQPVVVNERPAPAPAPVPTSPDIGNLPAKAQDEVRDRLRRRNELRASRGLPPVAE